jgi:hypothetical protein
MGRGSSCLVFFRGDVSIEDVARALARTGLHVRWAGDGIVVRWDEAGPALGIGCSVAPHVVLEARDLAERLGQPALAACDRRFEILIEDLDATLDEINTLIQVQGVLEELSGGFVFNSWNGQLLSSR